MQIIWNYVSRTRSGRPSVIKSSILSMLNISQVHVLVLGPNAEDVAFDRVGRVWVIASPGTAFFHNVNVLGGIKYAVLSSRDYGIFQNSAWLSSQVSRITMRWHAAPPLTSFRALREHTSTTIARPASQDPQWTHSKSLR